LPEEREKKRQKSMPRWRVIEVSSRV